MSLGHTDEALAYYDAQNDWRAALDARRLRRTVAEQQTELAALAAELETRDRVPLLRERIAAAASARAECQRDVGELLDLWLGAA